MPSADDEMLSRLPTKELIDHAHVRYRKTIGLKGSVEFVDARNVIPHLIERIEKPNAPVSADDAALCERLRRPWAEGDTTDRVGDAVVAAMRIEALSAEVARLKAQTVSIRQIDLSKGEGFPE